MPYVLFSGKAKKTKTATKGSDSVVSASSDIDAKVKSAKDATTKGSNSVSSSDSVSVAPTAKSGKARIHVDRFLDVSADLSMSMEVSSHSCYYISLTLNSATDNK